MYRIKEIEYKNHTEYWVQKKVLWWWENTTISYFSSLDKATRHLGDLEGGVNVKIWNRL